MSAVDNLVDSNSKAELVALAEEYELDTEGTKADIAERIVKFETGVPDTAVIEEPEPEPEPEPDSDVTLVKYKGKSRWYEVGKRRFSVDKPFVVVPESVADDLFERFPDKFQPASRKEVQEFYS